MKPRTRILLCLAALAALALGWAGWRAGGSFRAGASGSGREAHAAGHIPSLAKLLASTPAQIGEYDIAQVNLVCAEGLAGAETLDIQECLATLDRWAERVRSETERHLYRYRANPTEFESSEGYFRMLMMAVVLYEDFSVRYNPARMSTPGAADPDDHFFADSRDIFLHGLLTPALNSEPSTLNYRTGTCSSMPVLYVAIGRRLGYPLKLATTKAHVFLRWEGAGERFDMEATGKGMNRYGDEHFKRWPFPLTEEEIQADGYLRSLRPAEELALFLSLRGQCLLAAGRRTEAVASYTEAVRLAPESRPYRLVLAAVRQEQAQPRTAARAAGLPGLLPISLSPQSSTLNQPSDPNPLNKMHQEHK